MKSNAHRLKQPEAGLVLERFQSDPVPTVVIELLGQPCGKGRPRFTYRQPKEGPAFGLVYTPSKTRAYERNLAAAAQVTMRGQKPLSGPLKVTITALFGVPRSWNRRRRDAALAGTVRPTGRPDWDNLAKVCDALNRIVWIDDAQVVEGSVSKRYSESPRFRIEISPVAPPLLAGDSDDDHRADAPRSARSANADRMETADQSGRNRLA